MLFANIISFNRHLISMRCFNEISYELLLPNIVLKLEKKYFSAEKLLVAIRNDKKRVGEKLSIIILTSDNFTAAKIDDLSDEEFYFSLSNLMTIFEM
jgi:3-dehydroquinate synthetase